MQKYSMMERKKENVNTEKSFVQTTLFLFKLRGVNNGGLENLNINMCINGLYANVNTQREKLFWSLAYL